MDAWLKAQLGQLSAEALLRDPADADARRALASSGAPMLDACSNDYLGLGRRAVSRETLSSLDGASIGAGASRLVQGTFDEHSQLEQELASWLGMPTSLLTLSAFAANVGLIPAVAGPGSLVVSDSLNHASIVDGCRLAKARVAIVPHLDVDAVERALAQHAGPGPAWVVTEGLFSMDGDSPDLAALRQVCDRFRAGLVVDEAHSLGVMGPSGSGRAAAERVHADVLVAGLGKAVGAQGGVVACSDAMRTWLWNRARSFVFSTAPSPALCRLVLEQVRLAQAADPLRAQLAVRARELRAALSARGLTALGDPDSPIVPIVLGPNERALKAMEVLRARRILAQAIRPPTVPPGAARVRITVHADWPEDAVARIVEGLEVACAS